MGDFGPRREYGRIRERSYQRGGFDRERRLQTTVAVGAAVLLLLGIGIGFALGRASAPKPVVVEQTTPPAVTQESTMPAGIVEEVPTETADAVVTDDVAVSDETTSDTTKPPRPRQIAPANGAVIDASRVNLRWSAVKDDSGDKVRYSFEIQSRASNGTYGSTQVIRGLSATSYSARVLAVRRRWRVWAVDASDNASAKSPWRSYIHKYVAPKKPPTPKPTPKPSDETT